MTCPYCQNEMEKGWIQCRDGVRWTPKRVAVAAFSFVVRDSVPLHNAPEFSSQNCIAHYCRRCNKVVIDLQKHKDQQ